MCVRTRLLQASLRSVACLALFAPMLACGGEKKPSIAEALATDDQKQAEELGIKAKPKPRPEGLPPPTDAEFKAWNRKDPGGEKHLYKWDKSHVDKMMRYWEELQCFQEKMKEEGEKAMGAEPGSPEFERWEQFKRGFIMHLDGWQKRLFANEPRILEKSKLIGHILEAHELVSHGYPKAYNAGDKTEIEKNDAHFLIVDAKVKKYLKNLGLEKKFPKVDPDDPKSVKRHQKVCEEAMKPPKKGPKKRRGRKTPI